MFSHFKEEPYQGYDYITPIRGLTVDTLTMFKGRPDVALTLLDEADYNMMAVIKNNHPLTVIKSVEKYDYKMRLPTARNAMGRDTSIDQWDLHLATLRLLAHYRMGSDININYSYFEEELDYLSNIPVSHTTIDEVNASTEITMHYIAVQYGGINDVDAREVVRQLRPCKSLLVYSPRTLATTYKMIGPELYVNRPAK